MKTQADYRRQTYYQNWFIKKILPLIVLVAIIGLIFLAFVLSNYFDHQNFKTPPEGEITLMEKTFFVPKGAYIIGEAHPYGSTDDVVFDNVIPENQKTDREELVRAYGKVVVYWSLDQKAAAEELLLDS